MTKKWVRFPHPDKHYAYDAAALKKHWARLHRGDCEPLPKDGSALGAWRHYHAGEFADAVAAGRKAGGAGLLAPMAAAFAAGQIAGPSFVSLLAHAGGRLDHASLAACLVLVASALALLLRPLRR